MATRHSYLLLRGGFARLDGLLERRHGGDVFRVIERADVAVVFGKSATGASLRVDERRRCGAVLLGELTMALRLHCHILEHAEHGMMGELQIAE